MKKNNTHNGYLTGRLLLSSPEQSNNMFNKSCILICAHDKSGAMGLILNKYETKLTLNELLMQIEMATTDADNNNPRIYMGGPVNIEQGFILHDTTYKEKETATVNELFNVTTTINILQKIARNKGPKQCKIALGHVDWTKGQLEEEIKHNLWLTLPATKEVVFSNKCDTMWYTTLNKNGILPSKISYHEGLA